MVALLGNAYLLCFFPKKYFYHPNNIQIISFDKIEVEEIKVKENDSGVHRFPIFSGNLLNTTQSNGLVPYFLSGMGFSRQLITDKLPSDH